MREYVKELNIIDFLGILIPGCILVLLVTGDQSQLLLWQAAFGADCSEFTRGLFLLIAGYLSGMVLHEIGDIIEKGVWSIPWLNPKAYAVYTVGIDALRTAKSRATSVAGDSSKPMLPLAAKGVLGILASLVILVGAIPCFGIAVWNYSASAGLECPRLIWPHLGAASIFLCMVGMGIAVGITYQKSSRFAGVLGAKSAEIQEILSCDGIIRTYMDDRPKGRVTLFYGFRHVMRNLLICLALVNFYSIWRLVDLYRLIGDYFAVNGAPKDFFWLFFWYALIVGMMFVRYCRYTYLCSKYLYERFLLEAEAQSHAASNDSNNANSTIIS